MQIDADKLRAALRERWEAAMEDGDEALGRMTAALDRKQAAEFGSSERGAADEEWLQAVRAADKIHARAAGIQVALNLIEEMTRTCETCGCSPDACGCVDNGERITDEPGTDKMGFSWADARRHVRRYVPSDDAAADFVERCATHNALEPYQVVSMEAGDIHRFSAEQATLAGLIPDED